MVSACLIAWIYTIKYMFLITCNSFKSIKLDKSNFYNLNDKDKIQQLLAEYKSLKN